MKDEIQYAREDQEALSIRAMFDGRIELLGKLIANIDNSQSFANLKRERYNARLTETHLMKRKVNKILGEYRIQVIL